VVLGKYESLGGRISDFRRRGYVTSGGGGIGNFGRAESVTLGGWNS